MRPLDDAVRAATATLTATGVPTAAADAEALARHVLDGDSSDAFDDRAERAFAELVRRRAQRVPLAHLTGRVPFRQVELLVGPGVFVPQPETASVVQWVVDAVRARRWAAPLMVDLCTGTGTIACTLANELPTATAHAVEQDLDALAWARRNTDARARAGDSRVHLHHGSAGDALPELNGQVDLVVSNPPYVATTETHIPQPEVVEHDPAVALWAGADGLDVVREVERAARRLLKPGGLVVVEHSDRQGQTAPALFLDAGGWTEVADHRDQDGTTVSLRRGGLGPGTVSNRRVGLPLVGDGRRTYHRAALAARWSDQSTPPSRASSWVTVAQLRAVVSAPVRASWAASSLRPSPSGVRRNNVRPTTRASSGLPSCAARCCAAATARASSGPNSAPRNSACRHLGFGARRSAAPAPPPARPGPHPGW